MLLSLSARPLRDFGGRWRNTPQLGTDRGRRRAGPMPWALPGWVLWLGSWAGGDEAGGAGGWSSRVSWWGDSCQTPCAQGVWVLWEEKTGPEPLSDQHGLHRVLLGTSTFLLWPTGINPRCNFEGKLKAFEGHPVSRGCSCWPRDPLGTSPCQA